MRVAPIGCYFAREKGMAKVAAYEGAQAAALTHGHTLGYIPAAFLSCLVYKIIFNKTEKLLLHFKNNNYNRELLEFYGFMKGFAKICLNQIPDG